MASLMFLKLGDKIKGESSDDAHKDWIEVLSYSWGCNQPVSTASGTGGRTGAGCSFSDYSTMKVVDKASPDIMLTCAKGEHIPMATFEVVQDTGDKNVFVKYEMHDVIISSYQVSGSGGGDKPMESLSLNYGKMKSYYTPTDHLGKPGTTVDRGWNCEINKPM